MLNAISNRQMSYKKKYMRESPKLTVGNTLVPFFKKLKILKVDVIYHQSVIFVYKFLSHIFGIETSFKIISHDVNTRRSRAMWLLKAMKYYADQNYERKY